MAAASRRWLLFLLAVIAGSAGLAQSDSGDEAEPHDPPRPEFVVLPYLQLPTPASTRIRWETNYRLPGKVEYGPTRDLGLTAEARDVADLHEVTLTGLRPATTYHYRVRSGPLVSETFSFKSAPPAGTHKWRMALYGDSRSNPGVHKKVVEQIATANVDLIVHTGDIVINGKNRGAWKTEFFDCLGPLARSVPWVATIGNHENSTDYGSYVALPDGRRYFGLDFANAHFICLDSNEWIEKGRDSKQYDWLAADLKAKRPARWTFAVFHHPLFSAMASRPLNPLRWDWAPLLLDPAARVDGVLAGHDHFFARSHRIGRVGKEPQSGVLFVTSAGGGAYLYRSKDRDYVAKHRPVHHFVLFEFDDDEVKLSAIDISGQVFDSYTLTKKPVPAEDFCAYEIEELRENLRRSLVAAPGVPISDGPTTINTELKVPCKASVWLAGEFAWKPTAGWKLKEETARFAIEPGQPLVIPLQAEVAPGPFVDSPQLTISFAAGKFRNRSITVAPFKLAGPARVKPTPTKQAPIIDGKLSDTAWAKAEQHALLGMAPRGGRAGRVQLAADRDRLYVAARLDDPAGSVRVKELDPKADRKRFVLFEEHVRVTVSAGKETWTFALAPDQSMYCSHNRSEDTETAWQAAAGSQKGFWTAELAIPRKVLPADGKARINISHQQGDTRAATYELCPTYLMGNDPDVIPDWWPGDATDGHALLVLE
jgi:hypothetical protein